MHQSGSGSVSDLMFANFADFDRLVVGLVFVQQLNAGALAEGTFATGFVGILFQAFTAVVLTHE